MSRKMSKKIVALVCSLLLVVASLPFTAMADESDSNGATVVYDMQEDAGISGASVGAAFNSTDHLQNSGGTPTIATQGDGKSIYVSGRTGNWQGVDIRLKSFNFVAGSEYTFTVNGHVDSDVSGLTDPQIIFSNPNAWGPYGNYQELPKKQMTTGSFTLEYKVTFTPGDIAALATDPANPDQPPLFRTATNNAAQSVPFYVDNITITKAATPPPTVIYDMQEDSVISAAAQDAAFNYTATIQNSGGTPTIHDNGKSIYISGRTNDYNGVDIKLNSLGLTADTPYTFSVRGHVDSGVTVPAGSQIVLSNPTAWGPYSNFQWIVNRSLTNGDYTLEHSATFTAGEISALTGSSYFRVQTSAEGKEVPFYVDNIVITNTATSTVVYEMKADGQISGAAAGSPFSGTNHLQNSGGAPKIHQTKSIYVSGRTGNWQGVDIKLKTLGLAANTEYTFTVTGHVYGVTPLGGSEIILSNPNGWGPYGDYQELPKSSLTEGKFTLVYKPTFTADDIAALAADPADPNKPPLFRIATNETGKNVPFYVDGIVIAKASTVPVQEPEWDLTLPSLFGTYENDFMFGNAISPNQITNAEFVDMYKHHYNVLSAENDMKPQYMSPAQGQYTYTNADKLVDWALDNDIAVHGHTLVWHSQSANWLNKNSDGTPLTRAQAKANMEEYISNVAGHYKDKVISWDVVNEAFADGGSFDGDWKNNLRMSGANGSPWYLAYAKGADTDAGESGADYIYDAFVLTRLTDPNAKLYYNDFNENEQTKREAIAAMVEDLNGKWATDDRNTEPGRLLIEGIGMQSHFNTGTLNVESVENAIKRFIATGASISVSELDIPTGDYETRNAPLTEDEKVLQAQLYAQLFQVYKKYADSIDRMTIWGVADPISWRAAGHPLLFDRLYAAKPAFDAVINPTGYITQHPLPVPQVIPEAYAVAGTAEIDGEEDAVWANAPVINANTKPNGQTQQAATAEVRTLWDDNYFYVYAKVADSELNNTSSNPWEQDSVEVFLSETKHRQAEYKAGDGQYRVTYEGNESFKAESMRTGFESSTKIIDGGYVVELKIPFSVIAPATSGKEVSFDVQLNDASADASKRRLLTVWSDLKANGYNTTENWGKLTLVTEAPPAAPAGLTAFALSRDSIKLDWNDASSVTFSVYRGTSESGPFSAIVSGITASEFTDTGLSASTTYYYKVNAVKNNVKSADSTIVHATTLAAASNPGGSVPNQPAAEAKDGQVTVKIAVSNGVASANVPIDVLTKALEQAPVNAAGKKQITVDVPAQAGATTYGVQLPVAGLKDSGSSVISIKTENGTVDLPGNMLAGTDVGNAVDVTVRVGKVKADSLSEDIRKQIGDKPVINLEVVAGDSVIAWNNPNAAVSVAIPYKPTAQELSNPDHIIIWYIDGNGKATPVPNARYDAASGTVKFSTTHFSNYAVAFVVKTFDDLRSVPWAKKAIEAMASRGIINGTSEKTYDPNASIKRADFLLLLVNALELKGTGDSVTMFSDVASTAYYNDAVKIAKQLGIIQGTGSNQFNPNSSISRQDMMVIAAKAAKAAGKALPAGGTLSAFSDESSVASYAKDSVTALVHAGIVQGANGKLTPNGSLTRAEAAVILQKIWSK